MPRPKNTDTIVKSAIDAIDEALLSVEELLQRAPEGIASEEVYYAKRQIEGIREKIPRLGTLIESFSTGKNFLVIGGNGEPREATADEARRLIMRYPKKGNDVLYVQSRISKELRGLFERFVTENDTDGNSRPEGVS